MPSLFYHISLDKAAKAAILGALQRRESLDIWGKSIDISSLKPMPPLLLSSVISIT
jgi:hypothetical protein